MAASPIDYPWTRPNQAQPRDRSRSLSSPVTDCRPLVDDLQRHHRRETFRHRAPRRPVSRPCVCAVRCRNNSSNPFLSESSPCVVGAYVSYSVNVSKTADIERTIWFATYYNILVVVRNTGPDYNSRSSPAGTLTIWTHHMKDISSADYCSANH